MTRSIFILGFTLLLLTACSDIREYDLGEFEQHIVVDAIISSQDSSNWVINLTYSRPLNSQESPEKVIGAEIQVSVLIDGTLGATPDNVAQKLQLDETELGQYTFPNNPIAVSYTHLTLPTTPYV